jgi:hypothetical protein
VHHTVGDALEYLVQIESLRQRGTCLLDGHQLPVNGFEIGQV